MPLRLIFFRMVIVLIMIFILRAYFKIREFLCSILQSPIFLATVAFKISSQDPVKEFKLERNRRLQQERRLDLAMVAPLPKDPLSPEYLADPTSDEDANSQESRRPPPQEAMAALKEAALSFSPISKAGEEVPPESPVEEVTRAQKQRLDVVVSNRARNSEDGI